MHRKRSEMKRVLSLSDSEAAESEAAGGKGRNLAVMTAAGLPVPEGSVVTVAAYREFLARSGIGPRIESALEGLDFSDRARLREAAEEIQAMFASAELPEDLRREMEASTEGPLAVRSSAMAEDMPEASFAGQQDSFLSVPAEEAADMAKRCWASYWNERAIAYRHDARVPHHEGGMAVVLQRMVDARCAGIMFTVDPVSGEDRTVIEAVRGLGDGLAAGSVAPERYHIGWDGAVSGDGSVLSDDEAAGLAALGRRLEELLGGPQDVEWAIDGQGAWLLQSRPVTTVAEDDGILWTRAYGDEDWADATTPLFFSVMGPMLTEYVNHEGARIMGYREIEDSPLLRLHRSHIYFNTWVLEQAFSYYPRYARSQELLNYYPEGERERISRSPSRTGRALMSQLLVAVRDPDGMLSRTDGAYRRWAKDFMALCSRFDRLELSAMGYEELRGAYRQVEEAAIGHYRLIRYGMVSHSIASNMMLRHLLRSWLDDASGSLYSKLMSGLPGNRTLETNIALSRLARKAAKDRHVAYALRNNDNRAFMELMESDPMLDRFRDHLDEFLFDYGHRGHTREILYPRWAEDPGMVLDVLRVLMDSGSDLAAVEKEREKERLEAERQVLGMVSGMKGGALKAFLFRKVLKLAQTYLLFRENQRFYLDHILFRQRLVLMEYGRRLHSEGFLDEKEDVFFLHLEELFSLPGEDMGRRIASRRRDFMRHRDTLPPKFLRGRAEFDDTVSEIEGGKRVQGSASSPGVFRGRARVVESVADLAAVEKGDVLVASNTDPGWTAVFHRLGGLVTETGGILSHGAVVSREYGIPAVTAVKSATRMIRDGQMLTVDGNEGVIVLEE